MKRLLESDAGLLLAGVVLLLLLGSNARSVANAVVSSVGDAIAGVGDALNRSVINPAVAAATGESDATLGGKVWDWLHPQGARDLKNGVSIYPPGTLGSEDADFLNGP